VEEPGVKKVSLAEKFTLFSDLWSPKIAGEIGDYYLKLAKLKGEFLWHTHDTEDEMFLVVAGRLVIKLHDGDIELLPGEFLIIPHGVEHMPVADEEAHVVLFEPKTTVNTGDVSNERTRTELEWI
jgi:mannose-6-phosphate isomerase-like protein (cupin superfamily)